MQKLALELKLAMQRDGLDDADVATIVEVDRSTVNRWVNGRARISRTHHAAMACLLGVDDETVAVWAVSEVAQAPTVPVSPVTVAEADELRRELAELRSALAELAAVVHRTGPE